MEQPDVELDLTVNGEHLCGRRVAGDLSLVHFLHQELGLTGTKIGCSIGECRACTVGVRTQAGAPLVTRQSCMTSMRHVRGWSVTTVEGLAHGGELSQVQAAILDRDALQCGYCAPGFAVAGTVAVEHAGGLTDGDVSVAELLDAVIGPNLCRCTGYRRYYDAVTDVLEAARQDPAPSPARPTAPDRAGSWPRRAAVRLTDADLDALGYQPLFDEPDLELVRLLHDGAEIEHSFAVQYLYAAFSIRVPRYAGLAGWPSHRYGGRPLHLLGVAIEEMIHLDVVNELLVALGAAPHLGRQQFPCRKNIYPFDFVLEPLSRTSLAKYIYAEAPPSAFVPEAQKTREDAQFVDQLDEALKQGGSGGRPNQVGSLYRNVVRVLQLLEKREPQRLPYADWYARLDLLREEGETEHFDLFRSMFQGTHPALPGGQAIWNRDHEDHPALPLRHISGLPRSGEPVPDEDEQAAALRHLSNLHYWAVCLLLDLSYRHRGQFHSAARRHMTGPLRSLGSALAGHGQGVPFDVLLAGYAPGLEDRNNLALTRSLIRQVRLEQDRFARYLPPDYAPGCAAETEWELALFV